MDYSRREIHSFVAGMSRIPPEKTIVTPKELDEPDAFGEDGARTGGAATVLV
jgi:hypothetical protein